MTKAMLRRMFAADVLAGCAAVCIAGCTTFSSVRPAAVIEGPVLSAQASVTTPPGDLVGWIWSFDCAEDCSHSIAGVDVNFMHGTRGTDGNSYQIGGGLILPVMPYFEAYVQRGAAHGIGGRLGLPLYGWSEQRVYYRADVGQGNKVLTTTSQLFYSGGSSSNGQSRARMVGVFQTIGIVDRDANLTIVPALSLAAAHVSRNRWGERDDGWSVFAIASMTVLLHRKAQ